MAASVTDIDTHTGSNLVAINYFLKIDPTKYSNYIKKKKFNFAMNMDSVRLLFFVVPSSTERWSYDPYYRAKMRERISTTYV